MSIADEARKGELPGLEAMRDKLAADLDVAEPSYSAQLAARLQAVLERIGELRPAEEETVEDALAARRAKRAQRSAG